MTEHPITPPPELVQQWSVSSPIQHSDESWAYELFIAHQAAQWGADQELEACCEWLEDIGPSGVQLWGDDLRTDRRPQPPSLKQQALAALERYEAEEWCEELTFDSIIIRRALEALDD